MTERKKNKDFDDLIREKSVEGAKSKKCEKTTRKKPKKGSKNVETIFSDLMGPPPLLSDEDPAQYFALYQTLRLKLEPRDILEEFYVRQVMDDAWLVMRYRRMNSHILNMAEPTLGDEMKLKIDRYRNKFMGSEELLNQKDENLLLCDLSQYSCAMQPSDMIAKQFENRIAQINLIEGMIGRCLERMRRSHITLEDLRSFIEDIMQLKDQTPPIINEDGKASERAEQNGVASFAHDVKRFDFDGQ